MSSSQDARQRTKTYITTYYEPSDCTDDDGNNLGMKVLFADPDYPLTLEFKYPSCVDVIITVGKPDTTPQIGHDQSAHHYEERVPVSIWGVDKTGVTGVKSVWQVERELRRVLEENPISSNRTFTRVRERTVNLGSTILYCSEYELTYVREKTV